MTERGFLTALTFGALLSACSAGTGTAPIVGGSRAQGGIAAQSSRHAAATSPPYKIYVANIGDNTVTTYKPDGAQTVPTIQTGTSSTDYLYGVAVGPNGMIYALNFDGLLGSGTSGTVTTFEPDGTPTTPTITIEEHGYSSPMGLAVDKDGKIYVVSSAHDGSPGIVTTYAPDGRRTTPTFMTGPDSSNITVDNNGKIYVTNDTGPHGKCSVTTYLPDGTPTTPTLTREVHQPIDVGISPDGTILVANLTNHGPDGTGAGYVTTYGADGSGPLQRIKIGAGGPSGITVAANGKVYVAASSPYRDVVKTYELDGTRTKPTITAGLYEPSGITLH